MSIKQNLINSMAYFSENAGTDEPENGEKQNTLPISLKPKKYATPVLNVIDSDSNIYLVALTLAMLILQLSQKFNNQYLAFGALLPVGFAFYMLQKDLEMQEKTI